MTLVFPKVVTPTANRLLALLPHPAYQQVLRHVRLTRLLAAERALPRDTAYFPVSGLISLVAYAEDGCGTECALIGHGGMVGLGSLLGGEDPLEAQVQADGQAYVMASESLRRLFDECQPFRALMLLHIRVVLMQLAQSAVCNRYHTAEERLCRWLMLYLDLLPGTSVDITHRRIANMIGVERERVTEVIRRLEKQGVIETGRRSIRITDMARANRQACECFGTVKQRTDGLLAEPLQLGGEVDVARRPYAVRRAHTTADTRAAGPASPEPRPQG